MVTKKKKHIRKWSILLAEDDLKLCSQLMRILSKVAVTTCVENGQQAIETYEKAVKKKKPFDFILLDVSIPIIDGFEVLKAIRGAEEKANDHSASPVHIIMITAYRDSLMEIYNMGWDDFITKPIEPEFLIKRMKAMAG